MKVELNDLTIGISPLTDEVFVGVNEKKNKNVWLHKKLFTKELTITAVNFWKNKKQEVFIGDKKYLISVKEIK